MYKKDLTESIENKLKKIKSSQYERDKDCFRLRLVFGIITVVIILILMFLSAQLQ